MPGVSRGLHHHNTWEVIIVDNSSEGPGFTYFNEKWWMVDPGGTVFVPKGYPHAWSCGNNNVFKMLWIYGGTREEAGRCWEDDSKTSMVITPKEEILASRWT
ncbi:cupin domain-containing protein [Chloroflexota bacterium]